MVVADARYDAVVDFYEPGRDDSRDDPATRALGNFLTEGGVVAAPNADHAPAAQCCLGVGVHANVVLQTGQTGPPFELEVISAAP
jgi:hypothetical protein